MNARNEDKYKRARSFLKNGPALFFEVGGIGSVGMNKNTNSRKPDFILTMLFTLLCVGLLMIPTGFEGVNGNNRSEQARARVTHVDNTDIRQNLIVKSGTQEMTVDILNGPFKGKTAKVLNHLQGKMELDEVYEEGNALLVEFSTKDGEINRAYARGKYRIHLEVFLLGLFGVLLIIVGGWTGLKALLSFCFAGLMIWKIMIPLFLKGYDPIFTSLGVVVMLTGAISFMVGGFEKKGLVTFSGAFLGIVLTCVLATVFSKGFHIHGAVRPFAETLLYSGFYHLNLTKIFLAGIFVSSSGAVMDLAMDISSAMYEVKAKEPEISVKDHIASGMAVGRSVIGTMTTTLLLAYSGSYMAMFMLFMSQGMPLANIFNLNFVAAEVLNTIVGSFGLVTVAPFTALMGGVIYGRHRDTSSEIPAANQQTDNFLFGDERLEENSPCLFQGIPRNEATFFCDLLAFVAEDKNNE